MDNNIKLLRYLIFFTVAFILKSSVRLTLKSVSEFRSVTLQVAAILTSAGLKVNHQWTSGLHGMVSWDVHISTNVCSHPDLRREGEKQTCKPQKQQPGKSSESQGWIVVCSNPFKTFLAPASEEKLWPRSKSLQLKRGFLILSVSFAEAFWDSLSSMLKSRGYTAHYISGLHWKSFPPSELFPVLPSRGYFLDETGNPAAALLSLSSVPSLPVLVGPVLT